MNFLKSPCIRSLKLTHVFLLQSLLTFFFLIDLFNKYLLSIYHLPGTVLGTEGKATSKAEGLCPRGAYIPVEEKHKKHGNRCIK